ncbi:hypothetical protein [Halanaerobium saccharolyticum]|uniref:hypothetical protein n=1 Tax=Halanaerobium saccharolyticum TaxID=43595 RepID=UPI00135F131F|nr:hypothetical protein [Halanaerobium saccharolyticum]
MLKKFQLTIDQAGEEGKRSDSLDDLDYNQYDEEEVEKRINEAEKKSLAKRKEEILNRGNNSNKNKKADERQINELKKPNKSNSFAKTFSQYSEVEKVVIYNEILSKPKALRKN